MYVYLGDSLSPSLSSFVLDSINARPVAHKAIARLVVQQSKLVDCQEEQVRHFVIMRINSRRRHERSRTGNIEGENDMNLPFPFSLNSDNFLTERPFSDPFSPLYSLPFYLQNETHFP